MPGSPSALGFAPSHARAALRRPAHRHPVRQPERDRRHQRPVAAAAAAPEATSPVAADAAARRRPASSSRARRSRSATSPSASAASSPLDGVDLDVRPGEVLGLIGPNGAGKTTFIDAVTGFVTRRSGEQRSRLDGAADRRVVADPPGPRRPRPVVPVPRAVRGRHRRARTCSSRATTRRSLGYGVDLVHPGRPALSPVAVAAVREFGLEADLDALPGLAAARSPPARRHRPRRRRLTRRCSCSTSRPPASPPSRPRSSAGSSAGSPTTSASPCC